MMVQRHPAMKSKRYAEGGMSTNAAAGNAQRMFANMTAPSMIPGQRMATSPLLTPEMTARANPFMPGETAGIPDQIAAKRGLAGLKGGDLAQMLLQGGAGALMGASGSGAGLGAAALLSAAQILGQALKKKKPATQGKKGGGPVVKGKNMNTKTPQIPAGTPNKTGMKTAPIKVKCK